MEEIQIVDTESKPKCPHCESEFNKIEYIKTKVNKYTRSNAGVFICPNCKTVLGLAY